MPTEPTKQRRPKFTLWGMLLSITMFAMVLALFLAYRELIPLRKEVRVLRDRAGVLVPDDENQLHALRVETFNNWAWKWRVWLPAKKNYRLYFNCSEIPIDGKFPKSSGINLDGISEGREIEVVARFERSPAGDLRLAVKTDSVTSYLSLKDEDAKWLLGSSGGASERGVSTTTTAAKKDVPFVLKRQRVFYSRGQIPPTPEPETTDGVMVWLEEI